MTITWRNVSAGSDSAALAAVGDAGRNIGSGINAIGSALENVSNLNQRGLERELNQELQGYRERIQDQHNLFADTLREAENNPIVADIYATTGKIHRASDAAILEAAGISNPDSEEARMALQLADNEIERMGAQFNDIIAATPTKQEQENYIRRLSQSAGQLDDAIGRNVQNYLFEPSQGGQLTPADEAALELQAVEAQRAAEIASIRTNETVAQYEQQLAPIQNLRSEFTGSATENGAQYLRNLYGGGEEYTPEELAEASGVIQSRLNRAISDGKNNPDGPNGRAYRVAEEAGLIRNGQLDLSDPALLITFMSNMNIDDPTDLDGVGASSEAAIAGGAFQSALATVQRAREWERGITQARIGEQNTLAGLRSEAITNRFNLEQGARSRNTALNSRVTFGPAK